MHTQHADFTLFQWTIIWECVNSRRPGVSDGFQPLLDSTPGLPLATLHSDTRLHKTIVCVCVWENACLIRHQWKHRSFQIWTLPTKRPHQKTPVWKICTLTSLFKEKSKAALRLIWIQPEGGLEGSRCTSPNGVNQTLNTTDKEIWSICS